MQDTGTGPLDGEVSVSDSDVDIRKMECVFIIIILLAGQLQNDELKKQDSTTQQGGVV